MIKNARIIGANQKRGEAGQERGHPDFVQSRSHLVKILENPKKWRDGEDVEEETKSMKFGSILDCLATSPDELLAKFAVHPENYPVTDKKGVPTGEEKPWILQSTWCKKWKADAEAKGLTVVSPDMIEDAKSARAALYADPSIASLIECSQKQVLITAEWHDEATSLIVPLSCLLDLVPNVSSPDWGKSLADIKTARNGNPARWPNVCDDSGYDVQFSLYFDVYRAARPNEDRTDFVHVVIENTHPFHVVTPAPAFTSEFLDWGRQKYKAALRLYCQCLKTGIWPSYAQAGQSIPQSGGGKTQMIGPEDCWNYRKCAGMAEFKMPPPQTYQPEPRFDTIP